jgi:2-polyprenyl-6-methoxyphenol hydroxylase-like FAD-dependent oxidoreductase
MEPTSAVYSNRAFQNRWRHYERWSARLDGFIVTGDAACIYKPSAGQGMSVAAVEATILRDTLRASGSLGVKFAREFLRQLGTLSAKIHGV